MSDLNPTLDQVRALVAVPDEDMLPLPGLFLHRSAVHGQDHVGRVMIHALCLVAVTGFIEETVRLWAAVYLHDIARHGDGREPSHGARAWGRLSQLPEVAALFRRAGVLDADLPAIEEAVKLHSRGEAAEGSSHARLVALLKDADGLDRVRIFDLNPAYLRHDEARAMVRFAEQLWEETDLRAPLGAGLFAWLWRKAHALTAAAGSPPPRPSYPSPSDW